MAQPFETTFILFVDMLGFASLVESEGDEISPMSPVFTGVELYNPSESDSLLGFRFANFHRCLNEARVRLQEVGAGTAIVFSDSAFFRVDDLAFALDLGRSLMFNLVSSEVPARMGIGRGTYRMLRFLSDSSQHVTFHSSQFLGTGIVRAYNAERCGLPGLRILLHPDLESLLDLSQMQVVEVEQQVGLRLGVRYEVNYLAEKQEFNLGPDFDDVLQFDALRWMMGLAEPAFQYHYLATFHAWNRMRAQFGRQSYPWDKFLDRDEYDHRMGIRTRP